MGAPAKLIVVLGVIVLGVAFRTSLQASNVGRAELVIANGPDPKSLDPAVTTAIADGRILASLFEGLLTTDPRTCAPIPGLAVALPHVSEDGLVWTFTLREGLRWSDGEPLDAHDLKWSFVRFLDPRTAAGFTELLLAVEGARAFNASGTDTDREAVGIDAPDARTVRFRLASPLPSFAAILTLPPLYPVPRHVVERHGAAWCRPDTFVGNGPFTLDSWRLRDRVRVVKNPHYRDAGGVSLHSIDFLCVESAAAQLNLYVSGAADIITEVPTSAVPTLIERFGPTGEFAPTARLGTFFFKINTRRPPFTNAKVRRALSLAVDRRSIVDNVTRAGELPALSFVPPGTRCVDAAYAPPRILALDMEEARRLLAEGLQEEGLTLEDLPVFEVLYSPTEVTDQATAEVLQKQWEGLGIRCRLVNMDGHSIRHALNHGDYAIGRASWIGDFNDPSNFLDLFLSTNSRNQTGWADADFDAWVGTEAPRTRDAEARAALMARAEQRLLEASPIIPIFHYASRSMARPWVTGFHRNVLDWHPPGALGLER